LIINYAVMPSFVSAMYRREGGLTYIIVQKEIKGTPREYAALGKISPDKTQGLIIN
jgi:hypothetical protein